MAEQKAKKSTAGPQPSSPITFSVSDIKELFILMKENNIAELNIEQGETKIHIIGSHAPAVQAAPVPPVVPVVSSLPAVGMVPPSAHPTVAAAPVASASGTSDAAANVEAALPSAESEAPPSNVKTINSPMVGTFYRAPAPDAPPFVEVGDRVKEDTTLCIIEAMKLMNEIKAEMRGKVVKILVENGMPVEYGQPLFLIEPE